MQTRHRFDQVVETEDGLLRVRCRPRGSALRDATDEHDWLNYLTDLTGVLGAIGWLLHRTVFLSKWFVTVEHVPGPPPTAAAQWFHLSKADAESTFDALVSWLQSGRPVEDFDLQHVRA